MKKTGFEGKSFYPSAPRTVTGAFTLLLLVGFAAMWSSSMGYSLRIGKSASYFALRQALFILPSVLLFVFFSIVKLETLRKYVGILTLMSLISLLLPMLPGIGVTINGGRRWINLGFTNFQPSELWKPMSILYAAHMLDKKNELIKASFGEAFFPFFVISVGIVFIFFQNDFSTAVLALISVATVFWTAGVPFAFFIGVFMLGVISIVLMVGPSEYRMMRIVGYLIPDYDAHGINYQVQNSIRAIMSGGLLGKGLGLGTRKLASIPEIQSDFVFAGFVEETGLLGVSVVLACWIFIGYKVLKTASKIDGFKAFLAVGLFSLLSFQVLFNLGVISGFLPATGIALPFFSQGGSSLAATAITAGLIVNTIRDDGFAPLNAIGGNHD